MQAAICVELEPRPRDGLALIGVTILNAEGLIILQTISAADHGRGRRVTQTETVAGKATLIRRLAELVPAMTGQLDPILAAAE